MKKVIINGYSLVKDEIFGIQRNTLELLREIDKFVSPNTIELIVPRGGKRKLEFMNIKLVYLGDIKSDGIKAKAKRFYWKWVQFPSYAKREKGIVVDMLLTFPKIKCDIVAIYDCIPERFPNYYGTLKLKLRRYLLLSRQRKAIINSRIILTDSESAKEDISYFYGVNPDKIKVLYCGWQHFKNVEPDISIIDRLRLEKGEYYFSLGSRLLHKNTKWIIAAAQKNPNEKFVISGSKLGSNDVDNVKDINNIVYAGYLSDSEVKGLMMYCKAFIQPSLYEGFGIPPMEAMSTGAECIVSNCGSLPEVYKNSVWYIDPYDYENVDLEAITNVKKEDKNIILDSYSWEKSAKMFLTIIDSLQ